jgi:hypothetical protein
MRSRVAARQSLALGFDGDFGLVADLGGVFLVFDFAML